jgi:hypothetical protein
VYELVRVIPAVAIVVAGIIAVASIGLLSRRRAEAVLYTPRENELGLL